ncbi:MAG TPA: hypothetical protein VGI79_06055 [Caulobacteraceae bacterium]|jgi:hypothetical protein
MLLHAVLACLPLVLVAATIVTVHSLPRALLLLAWTAAVLCGAHAAARLFKLMLAERGGSAEARLALRGMELSAIGPV